MIYVSDHGESLGEHGLYLHGVPYAFAPEQQTHVPFLMWMPPDFLREAGLDRACLAGGAKWRFLAGLSVPFDAGTARHFDQRLQPEQDLFKPCREEKQAAQ